MFFLRVRAGFYVSNLSTEIGVPTAAGGEKKYRVPNYRISKVAGAYWHIERFEGTTKDAGIREKFAEITAEALRAHYAVYATVDYSNILARAKIMAGEDYEKRMAAGDG